MFSRAWERKAVLEPDTPGLSFAVRVRQESEEVFASKERVSGFPEKGVDLRGSLGRLLGKSAELPGKSGKLLRNVNFHSERTSGEVAGELPGKFGKLPGKFGDSPEAWGSLTPFQRLTKFISKRELQQRRRRHYVKRCPPPKARYAPEPHPKMRCPNLQGP